MFDFERHASLDHILHFTRSASLRRKGRGLITRLSELPEDQRAGEIERLSNELFHQGLKRDRRSFVIEGLSDIVDVGGAVAGLPVPPLKSGVGLWNLLRVSARSVRVLDSFFDQLEQDGPAKLKGDDELDFLSKVSRVATLSEP